MRFPPDRDAIIFPPAISFHLAIQILYTLVYTTSVMVYNTYMPRKYITDCTH